MKQIATANYDCGRLGTGGYVYVNKTDTLPKLASNRRDAIYFIPHPRNATSTNPSSASIE